MTTGTVAEPRAEFRRMHSAGTFVLPNPWDVGSALLLEQLGFRAVATTSSGLAATLGRPDTTLTRDELLRHVAALTAALSIPVAVDAERGYASTPDGVARTVELLAEAGASGVSIEDYEPDADRIDQVEAAAERVAAAAQVCDRYGIVLTGRAENHLHGIDDLDDTVARLVAYRKAGAGAVYAPGLTALADITELVTRTGAPVNVLALPGGPTVPELAAVGVRRVSTGGALTWTAYGALVTAARELLDAGTSTYLDRMVSPQLRAAAFHAPPPS
jgi:2-methylisocitrate lyase-like PEP mutase family enzyme